MSMQYINKLKDRILAYSDLSPEEQDASPEAEALFTEVTKDLCNKGDDVLSHFSKDPDAPEIMVSDNTIATIIMTAAQYSGNPFLLMDSLTLFHLVRIAVGALVEAGYIHIPQPDVEDRAEEDRITTPNAGE